MIQFHLNNELKTYDGDENLPLLRYLRDDSCLTSPKDGCSGQAFCGACMVEVNGSPTLSCVTPMRKVSGSEIFTLEGIPFRTREILGKAFVLKGAVQCGFCTPGFLMRTKILLDNTPCPSREEIIKALKSNFCRCTGYLKIIEAIELAAHCLRNNEDLQLPNPGKVGESQKKYDAYQKAIGASPFLDDLRFDGMLTGALKFSDHPRAKIIKIDFTKASALPGVVRVFDNHDILGERHYGLIKNDWPLMLMEGETTRYVGDVLAGVVAESESIARDAVGLIEVEYDILEPVDDMLKALTTSIKIHPAGNLLDKCVIKRGDNVDQIIKNSTYSSSGIYETQRVEHAFLETEAAIALPWRDDGVELYVQSQGVYEDQRQVSRLLDLPEEKIKVNLVPNGGGFGGKEDMTVQGHAALYAFTLGRSVKVSLNRDESIRMHPKRHPIHMEYTVGCDEKGILTAVKARITGDTGAYASVGAKVLERAAGHATGAYHLPNVDIEAKTVYTNNLPCGAMRGFGVNQVTFAMESCIDDLCEQGGFDPWQFRYDNAMVKGSMTATGQVLGDGVGVRDTLLAVKDNFKRAKFAGLACGIKNCGVGNGMPDYSIVKIEVKSADRVILHHGWTEMGQGVNTVAQQILHTETAIPPEYIEVFVSTEYSAKSGMTTSSRGTSLVGNAIINASKALKKDLRSKTLEELSGKTYEGKWVCDWTTKPGDKGEIKTHYSYSYATQLVVLNDNGDIDTVYAAHDAGKIINPTLFEGQIQGSVHMGLGYALSEELVMEKSRIKSSKMKDLGLLKMADTPKIVVIGVEVPDPIGPYGAKGVGEIGLVPTAAAVANAFQQFDGVRRYRLPLHPSPKK